MGFFSGAKKVVKPFIDVPRWIGYDQLKEFNQWLIGVAKKLFIPAKAEVTETFEEAMVRLNLTEAQVQQQARVFQRFLIMWILIFFAVFVYAVYLAWGGSLRGFIVGVSVSFLALAQAFRYHFWLFQIKQRKLGCTFREWFNGSVKGE